MKIKFLFEYDRFQKEEIVEMDDNSTDNEIEEELASWAWNYFTTSYEIVEE